MQRPELLLPAGNLQKLKIGLQYGGDAFYLGFAPFSLRANDNGFTKDDFLDIKDEDIKNIVKDKKSINFLISRKDFSSIKF